DPLVVFTPTIGFETGRNFRNSLERDKATPIFRGMAAANLLVRYNPGWRIISGIEFTNSYVIRAPATKEIYTLSKKVNDEDVDDLYLNRKPRHYFKSELTLKLTNYFGFTTK